MLKKIPTLFGDGLGKVDSKPIHIDLKEGAKPSKLPYYNFPKAYECVTKRKVKRICDIRVCEKLDYGTNSHWEASTLVLPRKMWDIWVLMDLWEANKFIKMNPFPLLQINDIIDKI